MTGSVLAWLREVADPIDQRLIGLMFEADATADGEQGCGHSAAQIERGECDYVDPDRNEGVRLIASRYADWPGYEEEWRPEAKR